MRGGVERGVAVKEVEWGQSPIFSPSKIEIPSHPSTHLRNSTQPHPSPSKLETK